MEWSFFYDESLFKKPLYPVQIFIICLAEDDQNCAFTSEGNIIGDWFLILVHKANLLQYSLLMYRE